MTGTPRVALRGGWEPAEGLGGVAGEEGDREWYPAPAPHRSILGTCSWGSISRPCPLPSQKDPPAKAQEEPCSGSELNFAVN